MIGELVEHLARVVVRRPEAVNVKTVTRAGRVEVALQVAYEDFGRVIGKSGQTIGAIRTLAAFAAKRQGVDAAVEVVEEAKRASAGDADGAAD